jgi:tRNA (guanine10-N2)-dimethyltransferase
LPGAEAASVVGVYSRRARLVPDGNALFGEVPKASVPRLVARLALCRHVSEHLGSHATIDAARRAKGLLAIEGESVRVRAKLLSGDWSDGDRQLAEARVGEALSKRNTIDLRRATTEVRVLLGRRVHVCRLVGSVDRKGLEARKGENRPFFSPVSLHPKFARALVNLAMVPDGGTLLDPFCGTGGILIEAALVGARPLGGDVDPRMLEGARWNMAHFGLRPERLELADIGAAAAVFGKVDAIATDPPYGRASYTAKESPAKLHARMLGAVAEALREGGRAAIILPSLEPLKALPRGLRLVETHASRVHRSLVRHFVVLEKVRGR